MYASAEVRWFLDGPLPAAATAWFEAAAGAPDWEERTDRYARPACADGLGVKWRSGNLEVKRLVEIIGEARLHERAAGRIERFRKWSLPLAAEATLDDAGADWIDVAKRRRVRTFAAADGAVQPAEEGAWVEAGCGVEIGEVRVGGRAWWSVCFEAFGPDEARLADVLRRVAAHVLARGAPPALPAERAMSYPRWLVEEVAG